MKMVVLQQSVRINTKGCVTATKNVHINTPSFIELRVSCWSKQNISVANSTLNTTQSTKIDYVPEYENKSRVTIVSAFFHLKKSKHTIEEYTSWLKNFLAAVEAPVILYTDETAAKMIKELRGDKIMILNTTMKVNFSEICMWNN